MTNKSKNAVVSSKEDKVTSIKEVQASIVGIKKKLDEEIKNYQRKAKLIEDRDKFTSTRDEIMAYIKDQGVDYNPSLDSKRLSLKLADNRSYNHENIISISNNAVIRDMMGILLTRINQKITEIEKQILS